jgi:ankyrin repeat protein
MKRDKIIFKIVNVSLAFLISASHIANAIETDKIGTEGVKPRTTLTDQVRIEVTRILEQFHRNMEAYYERTRVKRKPVEVEIMPEKVADKEIEVPPVPEAIPVKVPATVKDEKKTPMHGAAEKGDVEAIRKLYGQNQNSIKDLDSMGKAPIHYAVEAGNIEAIRVFTELGANVNAQDGIGKAPIHYAVEAGNIEAIRVLKELGANVNIYDGFGKAPIHYAVEAGNIEAMQVLKELGANVNAIDSLYATPLHYAVKAGNVNIIRALKDLGADLNPGGPQGKTPLHYAVEEGNVEAIEALAEKVGGIKRRYLNLNIQDKSFQTPMHYAAKAGNVVVTRVLLDLALKASVEQTSSGSLHSMLVMGDILGKNWLHHAVETGNIGVIKAVDDFMKNIYATAPQIGRITVLINLKTLRDEVNLEDRDHKTPMDYAKEKKRTDFVEILNKLGVVSSSDLGNTHNVN